MAKWFKPTLFTRQNSRHLLSSNGKTVNAYCLQMAKPSKLSFLKVKPVDTDSVPMAKLSTPTVFKWQSGRQILSSNDRTGETYFLQTTKPLAPKQNRQQLLSSNGKTVTPTIFK
jgi:hypothetical protein